MNDLLYVALALGGLVSLIALSVASGNLATVEVGTDSLVVRLRGLNKVWAFKSKIEVPLAAVRGVSVTRLDQMPIGLRLPGTSVPGLIVAGSYKDKKRTSFYAIRRKHAVLQLELGDFRYDRIVVETASPDASAEAIRAALAD